MPITPSPMHTSHRMLGRERRLFRQDSEEKNMICCRICILCNLFHVFTSGRHKIRSQITCSSALNDQYIVLTLALSMTLFRHRRCHLAIIDTTCNGNEMRLDQPQKGRSSDKCEAVNALGICCYFEIKSNQV
ncbi:hypothetical protein T09_2550 [Trichinella sp. T9]|nr:hypothetical protein T09_2550 [Trichinella sp. T9]